MHCERPSDSRIVLERTSGHLTIHVPAKGMRPGTWLETGISLAWLAGVSYMMLAGGLGSVQEGGMGVLMSVGFWLTGLAVLAGIVSSAHRVYTVSLDARQLVTQWELMGWTRRRVVPRWLVQSAREHNFQRRGTRIDRSVDIVDPDGSFRIPCDSVEEQRWLAGELNDCLRGTSA